jgi:hypothetical protein
MLMPKTVNLRLAAPLTAFLRVKNWSEFQHYKDRDPPWIKLHRKLLDDYEFCKLSDASKAHLMLIWIFAARSEGRVPADATFLQNKLGLSETPDLAGLVESGFLIPCDGAESTAERWPSRYIGRELKAKVLDRDNTRCVYCGSTEDLEIDHIIPVSKGGESILENLQVLCRPCNRRKRASVSEAEQVATQTFRSAENFVASRVPARSASVSVSTTVPTKHRETPEAFADFWAVYPKRRNRGDAERAWGKIKPNAEMRAVILKSVEVAKCCDDWTKDAGKWIPYPASWLNAKGWEDEYSARPLRPVADC